MKKILFIIFSLAVITLSAQEKNITYYEHIAPIIEKNCSGCHQPGKSAPFSLLTYDDVMRKGEFIGYVTKTKYMPPWKADPTFQEYLNERTLSDSSIQLIQQWVKLGMPKGKEIKKVSRKDIKHESQEQPDLKIQMKEKYAITTDNTDDYRFFNIPTNLKEDQFISKIEFIPGNPRLVHHSRLMTDTTHRVREIDGLSANDPKIATFEKYPPIDKFLYGWVPGNFPITFPKGTGKKLHKNSDVIMNVHYAPNSKANQVDQSTVNFYFAKEKIEREVYSLAIAEENISNKPFLIKANDKPTFYSKFGPLPVDISVIGVLPHMHNLGKTFRAFAITPQGGAVHLIKINEWDFKWQDTYQFKKLLHIPKGSTILIEATFDNTADNSANPNDPPKDVTYGWNTTSEMLDMVLYYLIYKEGDEELSSSE